ncbi:hypothetical protein PG988_015120 [Apiospora saccharicola]
MGNESGPAMGATIWTERLDPPRCSSQALRARTFLQYVEIWPFARQANSSKAHRCNTRPSHQGSRGSALAFHADIVSVGAGRHNARGSSLRSCVAKDTATRDSDRSFQPSKRMYVAEEPPQTPAGVPRNDNRPSFEQHSPTGERQIKRLRSGNITLVGRLHEALQKVGELHHCAGATDQTNKLILQHENLVLTEQLLAFETVRDDSGLIETGSLGPSRKDINAELEEIEDSIANACASLSWCSWMLDQPKKTTNSVLSQLVSTLDGMDFESFVAHCKEHRIGMVDVLRACGHSTLGSCMETPLEETVAEESPIVSTEIHLTGFITVIVGQIPTSYSQSPYYILIPTPSGIQ